MKKKIILSVCLPTWFNQEFEVNESDIDNGVLNEDVACALLDDFDFSECDEGQAEYKVRNANSITFYTSDQYVKLETQVSKNW